MSVNVCALINGHADSLQFAVADVPTAEWAYS